MSDTPGASADKMPDDEELQEPSTEKEPGEEPKGGDQAPEAPDHEAVGIGVIEDASVADTSSDGKASPPRPEAETAASDSAPPTDAASDEVRSAAAGIEPAGETGE